MGADRLRDVGEIGRPEVAPLRLQLQRRFRRLLLALGDDSDEIALDDHRADAGNIGDGASVDGNQTAADEIAGVQPGIGRPHDPAVQHAGHAHVMDIDEAAIDLGGDVDAGDGGPDQTCGARRA